MEGRCEDDGVPLTDGELPVAVWGDLARETLAGDPVRGETAEAMMATVPGTRTLVRTQPVASDLSHVVSNLISGLR